VKFIINIPADIKKRVYKHLFQNELEQGAFLYSHYTEDIAKMTLEIVDQYLVPRSGWHIQSGFHLELKDDERAKIMKLARDKKYALIDCHSHINLGRKVAFSLSDKAGIGEFSGYVKWKLDGRSYVAIALNKTSADAVGWHGDYSKPCRINEIRIVGSNEKIIAPRYTWPEKISYIYKEEKHGGRQKRKTNSILGNRGSGKD
jgi:hypothetical protein